MLILTFSLGLHTLKMKLTRPWPVAKGSSSWTAASGSFQAVMTTHHRRTLMRHQWISRGQSHKKHEKRPFSSSLIKRWELARAVKPYSMYHDLRYRPWSTCSSKRRSLLTTNKLDYRSSSRQWSLPAVICNISKLNRMRLMSRKYSKCAKFLASSLAKHSISLISGAWS